MRHATIGAWMHDVKLNDVLDGMLDGMHGAIVRAHARVRAGLGILRAC